MEEECDEIRAMIKSASLSWIAVSYKRQGRREKKNNSFRGEEWSGS